MSVWVILTMILRVSFGVVDSVGKWSRFHWSPQSPPVVVVKVNLFAASSFPPKAGFPWDETGCCWLRLLILPARGQVYGYCLPVRQPL